MQSPYQRIINDIHHLRRIYEMLGDAGLSAILTSKLKRLDLQPVLTEARRLHQQGALAGGTELWNHPLLLSPVTLTQLMESLAFFRLGDTVVSRQAVELLGLCTALLSPPLLARGIGACAAMGEEGTAAALPLLTTALGSGDGRGVSLFTGPQVLLLVTGLQKAGVTQEELWRALLEHLATVLDSLEGPQLLRLITLLHAQQGTVPRDCAEVFYGAVVQHILLLQHRTGDVYLTRPQLEEIFYYLQEAGQPVMELQSLLQRGASPVDVLERFTPSTAVVKKAAGEAAAASPSMAAQGNTLRFYMPVTEDPSFVEVSAEHLKEATPALLQEWLSKCHAQRLMHSAVMTQAVRRWRELYFTASTTADSEEKAVGRSSYNERRQMLQLLWWMLRFRNVDFFTEETQLEIVKAVNDPIFSLSLTTKTNLLTLNAIVEGCLALFRKEYQGGGGGKETAGVSLVPLYTQFIELVRQSKDVPRLLSGGAVDTAHGAAGGRTPTVSTAFLVSFTSNLVRLQSLGGAALLMEHLSSLSVAAVQTHNRTSQLELVYILSEIKHINRQPIIPLLLRTVIKDGNSQSPPHQHLASRKHKKTEVAAEMQVRWALQLTTTDLYYLLHGMLRARIIDDDILRGVTYLLKEQPYRVDRPEQLTQFAYCLVLLKVQDVELLVRISQSLLTSTRSHKRPATVHDLALMLFTLTHVLRGVIRVVQELLSRIKVSSKEATPTDIQYILVSMVRLSATNHNKDVTLPLCERAAAILPEFNGRQLTNVWASLQVLRCLPAHLATATGALLERYPDPSCSIPLTPAEFISVTASVLELQDREATRRATPGLYPSKRGQEGKEGTPWVPSPALQSTLRNTLLELAVEHISGGPPLSGTVLYSGLQALPHFQPADVTLEECQLLLYVADTLSKELISVTRSNRGDEAKSGTTPFSSAGASVGEVLVTLFDLYKTASSAAEGRSARDRVQIPTGVLQEKMTNWERLPKDTTRTTGEADALFPLPPRIIQHLQINSVAINGNLNLREKLSQRGLLPLLRISSTPPSRGRPHSFKEKNPIASADLQGNGSPRHRLVKDGKQRKKSATKELDMFESFEDALRREYNSAGKTIASTQKRAADEKEREERENEIRQFEELIEFKLGNDGVGKKSTPEYIANEEEEEEGGENTEAMEPSKKGNTVVTSASTSIHKAAKAKKKESMSSAVKSSTPPKNEKKSNSNNNNNKSSKSSKAKPKKVKKKKTKNSEDEEDPNHQVLSF